MSDEMSKHGPVLTEGVEEVQGIFPNDAKMQAAIGKLMLAGFDRADLSLPTTKPNSSSATPDAGASEPMTDVDVQQVRTMGTSMAGTIGAFAAAGATIATGGIAGVAIAAAAVVGAGSALAVNAAGNAAGAVQAETRNQAALAGELVLAVHAPTPEKRTMAERIMKEEGATTTEGVTRSSGSMSGIDSSSWTG